MRAEHHAIVLMVISIALLAAWPLYNLALVWMSAKTKKADGTNLPFSGWWSKGHQPQTFWIVIPCLNEEKVISRTTSAALSLYGPPACRTFVLVVDDASDDQTPQILSSIQHPNLHVLRRALPEARRGKGEALNAAYRFIRKCTMLYGTDPRRVAIGVIDGDGRGSINILFEVSRVMNDPIVGAVQCRVRIHNRDRVLGAVQDLEFGSIANANQVLRDSLSTVGLGGNGQFTRLSTLMKLGENPWSQCLVEDLELGLRIHLGGEKIKYTPKACVTQQGVVDIRRLLRQRTRWAQGNLQCVSYVPRLIASRRISNSALVEMVYYLLSPWFNVIGTVAVTGLWVYAGWKLKTDHDRSFMIHSWAELAIVIAIWLAAMVLPPVIWAISHRVYLRDETLPRMIIAALTYPAFLLLGLISTVRALIRQATGRHTWTKTERLAEDPVSALSLPRHSATQ